LTTFYDEENNVIQLFYDDCREKKSIGRGVFAKVSRGMRKWIIPSEKEAIKLNGEVKVYKMSEKKYEYIVDYEAFKALSTEDKKSTMAEYIRRTSNDRKGIAEQWGTRTQVVHDWVSRLGLATGKPVGERKFTPKVVPHNEAVAATTTHEEVAQTPPEEVASEPPVQNIPVISKRVFTLTMQDELKAEELTDIINRLLSTLANDHTYSFELKLAELR
jgi:hypothetical protein